MRMLESSLPPPRAEDAAESAALARPAPDRLRCPARACAQGSSDFSVLTEVGVAQAEAAAQAVGGGSRGKGAGAPAEAAT